MKKFNYILAAILLCSLFCACSNSEDIVTENIEFAKGQLSLLLAGAEAEEELRIPSSFQNGEVCYVWPEDWVSGFFAGSLWYMYELSGDEYWAGKAQSHTEILDRVQYFTFHHDVGFMIGSSYGNGLRLKGLQDYDKVIVNAAKSLCSRFRPQAGVLQSWDVGGGWMSERGWLCPVIIDNMMNLELLFKASELSGDKSFFDIAVSHADKTIENHFREDNSSFHVVDYDPQTGEVRGRCTAQGYSDDSAWSRGQAWGLYGFTMAYRCTGFERYLVQAEKIAAYITSNLPEDCVPYWDFRGPKDFRDVSSAAISASALYELGSLTGKKEYRRWADKIIDSLSSPAYRAEPQSNGGFLLMHSVGSIPHGSGVDVPLNYADYYFLEALLRKRND